MEDQPKKSGFGKLLAALIIGGAVGSALGLAFAPAEGKKTREFIKKKAAAAATAGKKFLDAHEAEAEQARASGKKVLEALSKEFLKK